MTGSEQRKQDGNTEDDHLVVRGSLEHSPSGQPVVLHLQRLTAHAGRTTGCSAKDRERPQAHPTAEARQTGAHTDTSYQHMEDESKNRKRRKATEVLSDAKAADQEVKSQREQLEECWRAWKRQKCIPDYNVKYEKIRLAEFMVNDEEQHATQFAKWEDGEEERPTPRYVESPGDSPRAICPPPLYLQPLGSLEKALGHGSL